MFWNRFWLFTGWLPFVPSFLLASMGNAPLASFAPLYGFYPFGLGRAPASVQILIWGVAAWLISAAFAFYAYFVRPWGTIFAIMMWASTMATLCKLDEVLTALH
jgi:hypothetical protein